ncbi:hypothetical protein MLD38_039077 [Melastoma candidum]|uniref:Uncharacterized protein n=1 Tax=Melastoma candidum TaxID=119954 RepID=A0ACB9L2A0_9MYRT|nr:hypothetical protein MLD38_039077 [Melastoma candidum]
MRRKQDGKQAMGSPDTSPKISSSSESNYSDIEVTNANTICTLYASGSYVAYKKEGLLHGVVDKVGVRYKLEWRHTYASVWVRRKPEWVCFQKPGYHDKGKEMAASTSRVLVLKPLPFKRKVRDWFVRKARKERRVEREGRLARVRRCVVVTEKGTQTEIEFSAEKDSFGEYMCLDTNLGEEDVLMDGRESRENAQVPAGEPDFDPIRLEHGSGCGTNDPTATEEPVMLKAPEKGLLPKRTECGMQTDECFEQVIANEGSINLEHLLTRIVNGFCEDLGEEVKLIQCQAMKFIIENVGILTTEFKGLLDELTNRVRDRAHKKFISLYRIGTSEPSTQVYDEHYGSSSAAQPSQEVPDVAPLSFPEAINLLTAVVADPVKTPSALDLKETKKIMAQLSAVEDEPSPRPSHADASTDDDSDPWEDDRNVGFAPPSPGEDASWSDG